MFRGSFWNNTHNDARSNAQNNAPISNNVPSPRFPVSHVAPCTTRLVDTGKRTAISPESSHPYNLESLNRQLREKHTFKKQRQRQRKIPVARSVARYRDTACAILTSNAKAKTEALASYAISTSCPHRTRAESNHTAKSEEESQRKARTAETAPFLAFAYTQSTTKQRTKRGCECYFRGLSCGYLIFLKSFLT